MLFKHFLSASCGFPQFFDMIVGMEQIVHVLSRHSWKAAFEKMQSVNLTNDLHTDLTELDSLVRERVQTSKALGRFLKAASKTVISPLTVLKQAVLLHLHLRHATAIKPQTAIDFINFLLLRCDSIIELYGEGDSSESWASSKCAVTRSQATTREDETFQGKEVFLVSKIVKPYLRYLQRLVSSFEQFRGLACMEDADPVLVWRLVNQLRGVTGITKHFVMIGRYFMQDYGGAVVLLTGAMHNDITLYMNSLREYVRKQNYALACYTADTAEVEEFVSVLNELTVLNEELMQVYLGKYFFKELREFQMPEWINPNSAEFDRIYKIAHLHPKPQEKPKLRERPSPLFSEP